ncbi:hypothetical protein Tco_0304848 [Tanacetum coccineum]
MRPHRLLRLLSDSIIRFDITLGKASVTADALRKNDRAKPIRVRSLVMTINLNLLPRIHEARVEAPKKENVKDENFHGMDKEFENCLDRTLYIRRSWLPRIRDVGALIKNESHKPNYFIHPRSDKIYHNLKLIKDNTQLRHYLGNQDHQKSYADVRCKSLEFHVGAKVGTVSYPLELPEKLSRVNSTFHVLKLKKCIADEPLAIPLDEIQVDDKLNFIEEYVEGVMTMRGKRVKQSRIPIVKVRWNSRRGPEFT